MGADPKKGPLLTWGADPKKGPLLTWGADPKKGPLLTWGVLPRLVRYIAPLSQNPNVRHAVRGHFGLFSERSELVERSAEMQFERSDIANLSIFCVRIYKKS